MGQCLIPFKQNGHGLYQYTERRRCEFHKSWDCRCRRNLLFFIVRRRIYKPLISRLELEKLSADIKLEKDRYSSGELVEGVLRIQVKRKFVIREFKFSVHGREETNIVRNNKYYTRSNKFFEKDLSYLLKAITIRTLHDGKLEVQPGCWTINFEFMIGDLLDSYNGKYASITYEMNFVVNIPWRLDLKYKCTFAVINSGENYSLLWTEKSNSGQMERLRIHLSRDSFFFKHQYFI